jgi:hypothetical protein
VKEFPQLAIELVYRPGKPAGVGPGHIAGLAIELVHRPGKPAGVE